MSYCNQLLNFLKQAKTSSQAIKSYLNEYEGLKVRVSFGQGHLARVPWIAFLKDGDSVRSGIYPVFLFYKSLDLLILAYGVSENSTFDSWRIANPVTVKEYFSQNRLGDVMKYGNSYVYKFYSVGKIDCKVIDEDLTELISIYKSQ